MGKSKKRAGAPKYRPRKQLPISRQGICDQYCNQIRLAWENHPDMPGLDHAIFLVVNSAANKGAHIYSACLAGAHWDTESAYEIAATVISNFDVWGTTNYPYTDTIEAFVNGVISRLKEDANIDDRVMDTAIVAVHPEGAAAFGFLTRKSRPSNAMREMVRMALDIKISLENR